MVYVNNKKFACESCIKGHRSSGCHHTDRPLFEIKKKGRPVSQCNKCRELRQSKKLHSKCTCNPETEKPQQTASSSSGAKSRRFIPIIPALPNGLKDITTSSQITLPADVRQRVDTLLNPCDCKDLRKCKCERSGNLVVPGVAQPKRIEGLVALAQAAALQTASGNRPKSPTGTSTVPGKKTNQRSQRDQASTSPVPAKRPRRSYSVHGSHSPSPGPALAPIRLDYASSTSSLPGSSLPMPDFGVMPSMSEISSLAGSGCTCGVQCACPGCVEHRGPDHASHNHRDCADGCGTCIDRSTEMTLPAFSQAPSATYPILPTGSVLDRFFARAAALPPPPVYRTMGPDTSGLSRRQDFPIVNLPKLECCGDQCGCSGGQCTCRVKEGGCCSNISLQRPDVPSLSPVAASPAVRSCCAGK